MPIKLEVMKTVIIRSFLFSIVMAGLFYFFSAYIGLDIFLTDVGGLSAFLTVFGTLYGILAAFIVFEVWVQYNQISQLIDKEAQGIERLFRLTLYFRDEGLTTKMEAALNEYAKLVVQGNFKTIAEGGRNPKTGMAFRKIADIIRDIEFNDDHDAIVFGHILGHYGELGQIRTERLNQSLTRLPTILKSFIYISSFFALVIFLFMPFENQYYGSLSVMIIAFLQAMIFHIIEDLDNPFRGHWNLTPEPFARALRHIEEEYK